MPGAIIAFQLMGIGPLLTLGSPVSVSKDVLDRVLLVNFIANTGIYYSIPWWENGGPFILEDRLSRCGEPSTNSPSVVSEPKKIMFIQTTIMV